MNRLEENVLKYRELILNANDFLWKHPETGYREWETSKFLEENYEKLGYKITRAENIPGFYTDIDTGRKGPKVLILGEIDALLCPEHPEANKETGAAHCCGHCAQSAALLGIAAALSEKDALEGLCGSIRLCAVPAEELIEIEYRKELEKEGKIKYLEGKSEFLHRGYFDGVDLAFMVHTVSGEAFGASSGAVGCIVKQVTYKGKSAHAGANPEAGCNALYAATQGISAVNAIRETFHERDTIRVHPIITGGGSAVNTIPDRVTIESYVRGASFDAMREANEKVNRAFCGGALSLGANVEIEDMVGYSPLVNDKGMTEIAMEAAREISGEKAWYVSETGSGSTDMGDLSGLMPVVHPYAPGAVGISHGKDYKIENPNLACVGSAIFQLSMLSKLLSNNAERARKIISEYKPRFKTKEEFFEYKDGFKCFGDRIKYLDKEATVSLPK